MTAPRITRAAAFAAAVSVVVAASHGNQGHYRHHRGSEKAKA